MRLTILKYLLVFVAFSRLNAIVFETGSATRNTNSPPENMAKEGWELQGQWGGLSGTPVAPSWFVTVKHAGGRVGQQFILNTNRYVTVQKIDHPRADLTLWKVQGRFPKHADIMINREIGIPVFVFGRGRTRGEEVHVPNATPTSLRGWRWSTNGAGVLRWGTSQASYTVDDPATSSVLGFSFRRNADGSDEIVRENNCYVASGDSGGGVFAYNENKLKLVGLVLGVDATVSFQNKPKDPTFQASIIDSGGLCVGSRRLLQTDYSWDIPLSWQAIRISSYTKWINDNAK